MQAIEDCLPMVTRLRCWNHTINAMKGWLKKHGALHSEVPVYVSHLKQLLNSLDKKNRMKKISKFFQSHGASHFVNTSTIRGIIHYD